MIKNLPTNAGDTGDEVSIPDPGRSPGGRNGKPPGKSHGQRGLVGYSPWDWKESDMTYRLNNNDGHALNPRICDCVALHGKRTLQKCSRILKRGDFPECLGGSTVISVIISKDFYKLKREVVVRDLQMLCFCF